MKRRELKKTINYLSSELLAECIAQLNYNKNVAKADVENIMLNILSMQNDLVRRLSHVEPGSQKLFFSKLKKDMIAHADEIIDHIKALG